MHILLLTEGTYGKNTHQLCEVMCYTINACTEHECSLLQCNRYSEETISLDYIKQFDIVGIAIPSTFTRLARLISKIPVNDASFFMVNAHFYRVLKFDRIIMKMVHKKFMGIYIREIQARCPHNSSIRIINFPHKRWRSMEITKAQFADFINSIDCRMCVV